MRAEGSTKANPAGGFSWPLADASHRRVRARVAFAIVAVALAVSGGLLLWQVTAPRVVARAVAPDGTEMCIVQQCNWSTEPFTTSFVCRRPGGVWGRFYYDHQDTYWRKSRVSLDTNAGMALFYRGRSPAVTFAWKTETYTMHRLSRTITGPQWELPAGWSPERLVR